MRSLKGLFYRSDDALLYNFFNLPFLDHHFSATRNYDKSKFRHFRSMMLYCKQSLSFHWSLKMFFSAKCISLLQRHTLLQQSVIIACQLCLGMSGKEWSVTVSFFEILLDFINFRNNGCDHCERFVFEADITIVRRESVGSNGRVVSYSSENAQVNEGSRCSMIMV